MNARSRASILLALGVFGLLYGTLARAECGGTTQCIGVGPTEAQALLAHHGNGPDTFTLAFGNQQTGTASAAQAIYVAAVTGPVGTTAVLGPIAITGTSAGDFAVTGGSCLVSGPVHGGASCTITVAFSPASAGAKTATLHVPVTPPGCVGCITERVVSLSGTGTTPLPTANPATLTVAASTPTTLDLAAYIGGTGTLTVRLVSTPTHGTASLSGTRVTYTPATGYLGADAFSYDVTDAGGTSAPAVVTVNVVARPDPAADATVRGLVRAQTQTARRFSQAQVTNVMQRLESLHSRSGSSLASSARYGELSAAGLDPRTDAPSKLLRLPGTSPASAGEGMLLPASLAASFVSAASTRSLNLSAAGTAAGAAPGDTGAWIGGSVQFGTRDQTGESSGLRFSTDGVTAGIDRRVSERLALGMSVGHAQDQSDIGTDGSKNRSKGSSIAVYGSYQPSSGTFIDAMLGFGSLELSSERFVAAANDFARGKRKGDHWFGSVSAGYEFRDEGLLVSPYGRLDAARARLKQYTESGAGLAALTYFEQTIPTLQAALGLRAESLHETSFGWALPRLRLELRHDFRGERQATLAYADLPSGPTYSMPLGVDKRSFLVLGVGSDFILRGGTKLGVDYQVQRASGVDHSQAVRVWLSQELDGKGFSPGSLPTRLFADPVRAEASMLWDDNLNRARDAVDKRADHSYGLNLGKSWVFPLGEHTRVSAAGFLGGEKFARFPMLDRFSAGGQAEFQYRASGEFFTPIFGLLGRLSFDEYPGDLRSGRRDSIGITYRQTLTDRIDLFAAFAHNWRHADSEVFDARDRALRFNLDYSLGASGSLYLGGERRRGDVVSTVNHSAAYASFAKASVQDLAYGEPDFVAYRFDAKTVIWTLGYNLPLGPRDSLDFSARRASSEPTSPPSGIYAGSSRYVANQYSVAYLMRF